MSPPFVIVGAGSLGQSFAALLARAGEHVTLLATPRSADRLLARATITLIGAVDAVVPVSVMPFAVTVCGLALAPDDANVTDADVQATSSKPALVATVQVASVAVFVPS